MARRRPRTRSRIGGLHCNDDGTGRSDHACHRRRSPGRTRGPAAALGVRAAARGSAKAGSVADAVAAVERLCPRVLVLDLNMGGESSLDAIPDLRRRAPETQIVVLTMQSDRVRPGGAACWCGRIRAQGGRTRRTLAVRVGGLRGAGSDINPQLGATLANPPRPTTTVDTTALPRELEVLRLIALGHTNAEIARSLTLSVRTVESHRAHIHQKVEVKSRADLVAYAQDHRLLD